MYLVKRKSKIGAKVNYKISQNAFVSFEVCLGLRRNNNLIAGLHVTSWRTFLWSRIIACLRKLMQIMRKKLYCFDHQHGRLFTWLKTKNRLNNTAKT